MFSAIQLLEKISGEKLIYTNDGTDIENNNDIKSIESIKADLIKLKPVAIEK